jgi:serine/threonine-protein kinase
VSGYTRIRGLEADHTGSAVLARHDASGSLVVIRFLPAASLREPGYRARVRADANRLAGLQHSAVARLLEYVETDQGVAVVREHVDGVTVHTLLGDEDALGPQAALTVLKGTLLGLAAAHARGVLHRGCTPSAVLIARTGGVVLAEFGSTGPLAAQSPASATYFYLAPERWDAGEATPSADLYAAAATCFECIAGAPPFFSDDLAVLRSRHESTPPPIEVVPEAMRDLLRRGLAKAPAERPAGAVEFLVELEQAAVRGYGAGWEACGRNELAELAASARPPFGLDPATLAGTPGQSAPGLSFLGGFQLGRSGSIAAAVTFALVLGLALAMVVPLGDIVGGARDRFIYGDAGIAPGSPGSSRPGPAGSERSPGEFPSSTLIPSMVSSGAILPLALGGAGMTLFSLAADPGAAAFAPPSVRRLLGPPAPTPLAAPPDSRMRVSTVSLSSFERRGRLSRLVVQVTTTGTGPVQLILGYGSSGRGDAGPGHPSMVITRTLAGSTSYSVTDYRSLPADCTGSSFVLVTTTPAPSTGLRFAELPLGPCPVDAAPHSAPPGGSAPPSGSGDPSTPSTPGDAGESSTPSTPSTPGDAGDSSTPSTPGDAGDSSTPSTPTDPGTAAPTDAASPGDGAG